MNTFQLLELILVDTDKFSDALAQRKAFTRNLREYFPSLSWFHSHGMREKGFGDWSKVSKDCFTDQSKPYYIGHYITQPEAYSFIQKYYSQYLPTTETMSTTTPTPPIVTTTDSNEAKAKLLLDLLSQSPASVNKDDVIAIVDERLKSHVKTIEIKKLDGSVTTMQGQHYKFDTLLKWSARGRNVFLVGPAGSGKTTACRNVSEALGLPFYYIAISAQTTISQIFGYYDANGNYVQSLFRQAYENGGVFLLDEVDSGNANTLTGINAAIENGLAAFPDKMVKKHSDFVFVCAGNTWGLGADRQYVGRNQLDGAFLDRFIQIEWGYDETLELGFAPSTAYIPWVNYVQKLRAFCQSKAMKVIISPRKTLNGIIALQQGDPIDQVIAEVIAPAFTPDQLTMVNANVTIPNIKIA